jgi:hypothetical protein
MSIDEVTTEILLEHYADDEGITLEEALEEYRSGAVTIHRWPNGVISIDRTIN